MALKGWRWIWAPLLVATAVAVATLPPGILGEKGTLSLFGLGYSSWQYPPGRAHRAAVERAVGEQRRRLREVQLTDSILAAARGARSLRSGDGLVTVVYEAPITADSARTWLRAAAAEVNLYPKEEGRGLPVIVALLSNPRRQFDVREEYLASSVFWFSRRATGGRACIVTLNLARRERRWEPLYTPIVRGPSGTPVGRFLDVCALEGRYGAPGAQVSQWIDRSPNWYWRYDLLTSRLLEASRNVPKDDVERAWEPSFWYGRASWVVVGCLDGAEVLCARSAGLETMGQSTAEYYLDRHLFLGYLVANGTARQFAAFWRSPLAPGDALQHAYGRPPGQLAHDAFSHWYSAAPGGPRAEPRPLLAGLFWAAAALALALVAGRRWTTEI